MASQQHTLQQRSEHQQLELQHMSMRRSQYALAPCAASCVVRLLSASAGARTDSLAELPHQTSVAARCYSTVMSAWLPERES